MRRRKSEPQLLPEPGTERVLLPCKNKLSCPLQPSPCYSASIRHPWLSPRQLKIPARAAPDTCCGFFHEQHAVKTYRLFAEGFLKGVRIRCAAPSHPRDGWVMNPGERSWLLGQTATSGSLQATKHLAFPTFLCLGIWFDQRFGSWASQPHFPGSLRVGKMPKIMELNLAPNMGGCRGAVPSVPGHICPPQ